MRLGQRRLNRTLLQRQHLLERADLLPAQVCSDLVGLQAQDNLPPYLGLAARLTAFDPYDVSRGLEDRSLVRLVTMRSTVHLLVADDALALRTWTQPRVERELHSSQSTRPAMGVDRDVFAAALSDVLAEGPLSSSDLGAALARTFPDVPPTALGQLARAAAPLAQLPPRGAWKESGGVVYQRVDRWLGRALVDPDVTAIIRRYLRSFGPATAADVTSWSAITRLGPVLGAMEDLVRHEDERGRVLYDVPDGALADGEEPAPVRLLGCYDNVWLSHADRDRVTDPAKRAAWMGVNGGVAHTLFVDGMLEGLWRVEDGRVRVVETLRPLARSERAELDEEIVHVEALLAR